MNDIIIDKQKRDLYKYSELSYYHGKLIQMLADIEKQASDFIICQLKNGMAFADSTEKGMNYYMSTIDKLKNQLTYIENEISFCNNY